MLKVGDTVRWMCPLDNDYTYGEIVSLHRGRATVKGIGVYKNAKAYIPLRYIQRLTGGGNCGSGERNNKLFPIKDKL